MANNILLPIAGRGQRFVEDGYETPKPLIKTNGKYLIERSLESTGLFIYNEEFVDKFEENTIQASFSMEG